MSWSSVLPRGRSPVRVALLAALAGACLGTALGGRAEPYTPKSDDEVLERLPPDLRSADLRRQREELARDPENLRDSVSMARGYLDIARSEGDPRYLGHVQAILGPWWNQPGPPASVLGVRAAWRNLGWEYDRALADAEAALASEPTQRVALSARFEAQLARADYTGARTTLVALEKGATPLAAFTDRTRYQRVTGHAAEGLVALRDALAATPLDTDPAERLEAELLCARMAAPLGRTNDASEAFAALRRSGRRDVRHLAAEADFLLDQGRAAEAWSRLEAETGVDSLAVRAVEALAALPGRSREQDEIRTLLVSRLEKDFEARRRRGDVTGLPDEIRFQMRSRSDAALAVERSRDLWAVRRDPDDVRWILEAARAAKNRALAEPVVAWCRQQGITDVRVTGALRELGWGGER